MLQYAARRELVLVTAGAAGGVGGSDAAVAQLRARAAEEASANAQQVVSWAGQPVMSGHVVQLRHVRSGRFVSIAERVVAPLDASCTLVELVEGGSMQCWLQIDPVRTDQELLPLMPGAPIVLASPRTLQQLHVSAATAAAHGGVRGGAEGAPPAAASPPAVGQRLPRGRCDGPRRHARRQAAAPRPRLASGREPGGGVGGGAAWAERCASATPAAPPPSVCVRPTSAATARRTARPSRCCRSPASGAVAPAPPERREGGAAAEGGPSGSLTTSPPTATSTRPRLRRTRRTPTARSLARALARVWLRARPSRTRAVCGSSERRGGTACGRGGRAASRRPAPRRRVLPPLPRRHTKVPGGGAALVVASRSGVVEPTAAAGVSGVSAPAKRAPTSTKSRAAAAAREPPPPPSEGAPRPARAPPRWGWSSRTMSRPTDPSSGCRGVAVAAPGRCSTNRRCTCAPPQARLAATRTLASSAGTSAVMTMAADGREPDGAARDAADATGEGGYPRAGVRGPAAAHAELRAAPDDALTLCSVPRGLWLATSAGSRSRATSCMRTSRRVGIYPQPRAEAARALQALGPSAAPAEVMVAMLARRRPRRGRRRARGGRRRPRRRWPRPIADGAALPAAPLHHLDTGAVGGRGGRDGRGAPDAAAARDALPLRSRGATRRRRGRRGRRRRRHAVGGHRAAASMEGLACARRQRLLRELYVLRPRAGAARGAPPSTAAARCAPGAS